MKKQKTSFLKFSRREWIFILVVVIAVFLGLRYMVARSTSSPQTEQTASPSNAPDPRYPIGYGHANTHVDGYDVGQVNLWSGTDDNRYQVGHLSDGEEVDIMSEDGDYVKVRSKSGAMGWCRRGFIN